MVHQTGDFDFDSTIKGLNDLGCVHSFNVGLSFEVKSRHLQAHLDSYFDGYTNAVLFSRPPQPRVARQWSYLLTMQ